MFCNFRSKLLHFTEKFIKPLHIISAFIITICLVFSPVFAVTPVNYYNPSTAQELCTNGTLVYTISYEDGSFMEMFICSTVEDNDIYISGYYNQNNRFFNVVVSQTISAPFKYASRTTYTSGSITYSGIISRTVTTQDSNTDLYYNNTMYAEANSAQGASLVPDVDIYSDLDTCLSESADYIENPPSPIIPDPNYNDLPDFYIQRGYAAYIDFGSDWSTRSCSGTFTSTFPQYSSLISGDWDGTDNRRFFWTDSLPTNTSFSSNVGSAIDWTKVAPYDLLQRSKNGIWFIQSNSPLNRYLVIVNPNQWRYGQTPTEDTLNSAIKVSDLSGSTGDVQFFALNQQFDQTGTLVSSASDDASNNRTGTYDPDTGTWYSTDSSGNAADQVPGGMSDTPVVSSITDYISNITNILTNFANSVISLIQAPISHVAQLIEAGSGFMGALRGLYGWLPVDIQGLVISALTVVIGIGVFKVFL